MNMIYNDRQYRITKRWLARFRKDIATMQKAVQEASDDMADVHLDALKSEEEVLAGQVAEYERLRSGKVQILTAVSLAELPSILIRARIVKGMSQRELAEKLGLKEQQIQRYEADEYAKASLHRLRDVADALQLDIVETARFRDTNRQAGSDGGAKRWVRHAAGQRAVAQGPRPRLTR